MFQKHEYCEETPRAISRHQPRSPKEVRVQAHSPIIPDCALFLGVRRRTRKKASSDVRDERDERDEKDEKDEKDERDGRDERDERYEK